MLSMPFFINTLVLKHDGLVPMLVYNTVMLIQSLLLLALQLEWSHWCNVNGMVGWIRW